MLVSELQEFLAKVPADYNLAIALDLQYDHPFLVEIYTDDLYVNHELKMLEFNGGIAEEASDDIDALLDSGELEEGDVLVLSKQLKYASPKERATKLGLKLVK